MAEPSVNATVLLTNCVRSEGCVLHMSISIPPDYIYDDASITDMVKVINNRLASGKKPAGVLSRQLGRIAHHTEQLSDAYAKLYESYSGIITAQTRMSTVDKARRDMLAMMDMKSLRAFCTTVIGEDTVDNYILPDDKDVLITATVTAMKTVK